MSLENNSSKFENVEKGEKENKSPDDIKTGEILRTIENPVVSNKEALEGLAVQSLEEQLLESNNKEAIKDKVVSYLNFLYDVKGKTHFEYVMITKMASCKDEPVFEEILASHQAYINSKPGVEHGAKTYDIKSGEVIDQRSTVVEYEGFNMISKLIGDDTKIENEDLNYEGMNHRLDVGKHIQFLIDQDSITEDELRDPVALEQDHFAFNKFLQQGNINMEAKKYMIIQKLAGGNEELAKISNQLAKIESDSSDYNLLKARFMVYENKAEEILKIYTDENKESSSEADNNDEEKANSEGIGNNLESLQEDPELDDAVEILTKEEELTEEEKKEEEQIKKIIKNKVIEKLTYICADQERIESLQRYLDEIDAGEHDILKDATVLFSKKVLDIREIYNDLSKNNSEVKSEKLLEKLFAITREMIDEQDKYQHEDATIVVRKFIKNSLRKQEEKKNKAA